MPTHTRKPLISTQLLRHAANALLTAGVIISATGTTRAAQGDVTTLINNGNSANRVDIVFLGDGYTTGEQAKYASDVSAVTNFFFSGSLAAPLPRYAKFFNVHRIEVVSAESGSDHPLQNIFVNTALNTAYGDTAASERGLYLNNGEAAANALLPENTGKGFTADLRLVPVNDDQYGGAAVYGRYAAFAASNDFRLNTAIHEIGHSFVSLADEYGDYDNQNLSVYNGPEPFERNVTTDPTGAKWARWIGYNDPTLGVIGAYEEAQYHDQGLYRPSQTSMMRENGKPFDAVSKEAIISTIYDFVTPIDAHSVNNATINAIAEAGSIDLWVNSVDPTIFTKTWYLDGQLITGATGEHLDPFAYVTSEGLHTIRVDVSDDTDMVRDATVQAKMRQSVTWSVSYSAFQDADGDYVIKTGTLAFNLSGGHGLKKITADTATLTGDNTYTKDVHILEGRLIAANTHALGTGTTIIHSGASLDISRTNVTGIAGLILDGGVITGTTGTISAPIFELREGTVNARLAGGDVLKTGPGTVAIKSTQGLGTAIVTVNAGTLDIGETVVSGPSKIILNDGAIVGTQGSLNAAAFDINRGRVAASLSGTGIITKNTADTVTLAADNTAHKGTIDINAGTLAATVAYALGSGTTRINGGTLDLQNSKAASRAKVIIQGGSLSFGALTEAGIGELSGIDALTLSNTEGKALALTLGESGTSYAYNGTFNGIGSLIKSGNGTLTLSAINTHTGGTLVAAGTLVASNANALGAGDITLKGGKLDIKALTVATAATLKLDGGILTGATGSSFTASAYDFRAGSVSTMLAGTSAVIKTGTGMVTLSAENTYSGGTQVKEGTLRIENAASLGRGSVTVSGGELQLDSEVSGIGQFTLTSGSLTGEFGSLRATRVEVQSGTIASILRGAADITKTTTGTVRWTSSSAATGNLTIAEGKLIAVSPSALGSTSVQVNSGATLQLGESSAYSSTWSGKNIALNGGSIDINLTSGTKIKRAITGTGDVLMRGTGSVTLENARHTGTTSVTAGRLILPTATLPSGRLVTSGTGTLELNTGSGISDLTATIAGDGTLLISGPGRLRLLANSDFTGETRTDTGSDLTLGAPGATPITLRTQLLAIAANSRVGGSGTIAGSLVNQGTLAPGYSPGTITLGGDFVTSGTLEMEISATGAHDQIRYAGQALLGGTLTINYLDGTPAKGVSVPLLVDTDTGDGRPSVVGKFSTITTPTGGGIVFVNQSGLNFIVGGTVFDIPGANTSQRQQLGDFAGALNSAADRAPRIAAMISTYDRAGADIVQSIHDSAPLAMSALTALPVDQAHQDTDRVSRHLMSRRFDTAKTWLIESSPYAYATGFNTTADDDGDTRAFNDSSAGGVIGIDKGFDDQVMIGAQIGYDVGRANFHHGAGRVMQDHARATAYGSYRFARRAYVDAGIFGGYSLYDSTRRTSLGTESGDTHGWDAGAFTELGYLLSIDRTTSVTPHVGIVYTHAQTNAFKEKGTDLALDYDSLQQDSLATRTGATLHKTVRLGDSTLRFGFDVSWFHELLDQETDVGARVSGAGFSTTNHTAFHDTLSVGPELDLGISESDAVSVSYKYDIAFGDAVSHRFDIGYRTRF